MRIHSPGFLFTGLSALVFLSQAPVSAQQTLYSLANGGTTLIRFQSNDPSNVTVIGNFSGAGMSLDAIDFRPATGQLFGYQDAADSTYTVNLSTAELALVTTSPAAAPTNTSQLGMDFNPTIDRFRVVTDSDQNIVINPNNGVSAGFTTLFYAAGDVNEGADPQIIANAYNNNIAGTGRPTLQYAIDYNLDALVTLANNAGTLTTVGALGIDADINTGFDIFTALNGTNTAYALFTPPAGTAGLYTLDLMSGQAMLVGALGGSLNDIRSLAVVPTQVPEPGAAALIAGALCVGLPLLRRRRSRR